jgi:flagellar basal body-associated protein FliL
MKQFSNKRIVIIVGVVILLGLVILVGWFYLFTKQRGSPSAETQTPNNPEQQATTTLSAATASSTLALKTYRNKEWGFEFQYPED